MIFFLKVLGTGMAIAVVESTFLNAIDILGVRPDLLVIALILMSGRLSFGKCITLAFLLGLTRDFYFAGAIGPSVSTLTKPGIIGMHAFAFTVTAYILLTFEDLVMVENWTAQMFMAFTGSLIYGLCVLLLKPLLHYEVGPLAAILKMTIGTSLYTSLIAPAAFFLFRKPEALPYLRLKLQDLAEHETVPEIKT